MNTVPLVDLLMDQIRIHQQVKHGHEPIRRIAAGLSLTDTEVHFVRGGEPRSLAVFREQQK